MALRSLVGKLRVPPAAVAASRAFSQKCEHCGKTSSGIAGSLGQKKNGAIKYDFDEEFRRYRRKHYIIRAVTAVVTLTISGLTVAAGVAYLEDDENFRPRK